MATHSSILPGKFHGQRSLGGYSPWGCKRVRHGLATEQQQKLGQQILEIICTLDKQKSMVVLLREEEAWDSITKSSVKLTTLSKELGTTCKIVQQIIKQSKEQRDSTNVTALQTDVVSTYA